MGKQLKGKVTGLGTIVGPEGSTMYVELNGNAFHIPDNALVTVIIE